MKIQHLKKTVKLRIDRHIYYCYSKRKRQHAQLPPRVSGGAFKVKHFASFLRKYEIRLKKDKQMQTVAK